MPLLFLLLCFHVFPSSVCAGKFREEIWQAGRTHLHRPYRWLPGQSCCEYHLLKHTYAYTGTGCLCFLKQFFVLEGYQGAFYQPWLTCHKLSWYSENCPSGITNRNYRNDKQTTIHFPLQGASEKDIVHSGLAYTMERSARVSDPTGDNTVKPLYEKVLCCMVI